MGVQINTEVLNEFYGTLLNQHGGADSFYGRLVTEVQTGTPTPSLQDPFVRLNAAAQLLVDEAVEAQKDTKWEAGTLDPLTEEQLDELSTHAPGGTALWVGTLRGVCDLTSEFANEPQRRTRVDQNVTMAREYISGIAHTGGLTAQENCYALKSARDPHGARLTDEVLELELLDFVGEFNKDSFKARVDADGQVIIIPRFALLADRRGRQCPALRGGVELPSTEKGGDPRKVQGFKTFLKVIGDVAIDQIFVDRFSIIDNRVPQNG